MQGKFFSYILVMSYFCFSDVMASFDDRTDNLILQVIRRPQGDFQRWFVGQYFDKVASKDYLECNPEGRATFLKKYNECVDAYTLKFEIAAIKNHYKQCLALERSINGSKERLDALLNPSRR